MHPEARADVDDSLAGSLSFAREQIDEMQTDSQTGEESYAADPDIVRGVKNIVNFTLSKLTEIAFDSEQENVVVVEADTNAIILAHRFYGSDDQDENLERFIETNNIGLSEILLIEKDREVIYYA